MNVAPIVPDSFRFFADFLPALRRRTRALQLRLDERFMQEWREARPVPLDQVSPYEKTRVLDPAPDDRYLREALAESDQGLPGLRQARRSCRNGPA